jgi:hypothetical protein
MATHRIASGKTKPADWKQYPNGAGVFVDVDTSAGKFSTVPAYITSIGGEKNHWATTGASSIYPTPPDLLPTATKFRVYVRWANGNALTPDNAKEFQWFINWIGMEL